MMYTGPELKKTYPTDAGYDLLSPVDIVVPPDGIAFVETETRILLPSTHVGLVCPRSGLGKRGIGIVNAPGVIDSGYTGRIGVTLVNHTGTAYMIHAGDRIAQLVVVPTAAPWCAYLSPEEFERIAAECQCERGDNGFGSSGR